MRYDVFGRPCRKRIGPYASPDDREKASRLAWWPSRTPQTRRDRYARYERLLAGWTTRHRPDLARLLTGFTSPISSDLPCSDPQSTNET
ncbi:hypothetical protein M0M45_00090 [Salinispora arenicola]|uniref:Uncharacterized protein n=1 Tax=Salinispora arenicola TaxID=168697 RepID=A0ABQ4JUU0_SALAC|nr:hypothetical protein [Salinispora arenicola]GIM85711.1 hypothetical protein Sar04_24470 [Salinispora arenicola]